MARLLLSLSLLAVLLSLQASAAPLSTYSISETRELFDSDAENREAHSLVGELEWLLNQMVDMLDEMVSGIENDSSLLQNMNFRRILINILVRVDKILEHFENVHPSLLHGSKLHYELRRIDCVRIRLSNYLAGTRRFDDSACRALKGHSTTTTTTKAPSNGQSDPSMVHLVKKIFQVLGQVNGNLETLIHLQTKHNSQTAQQMPTSRPSTNWEQQLNYPTTKRPQASGPATIPGSSSEWSSLINQIMNGTGGVMGGMGPMMTTTTRRPAGNTTTRRANNGAHWEDDIANVINQWVNSMSRPRSFVL